MLINANKSVELRICFAQNLQQPSPLPLRGQNVPVVSSTKCLGYHLNSKLSGNSHIEEAIKKTSKLPHFLSIMARNGLSADDVMSVYTSLIRPCPEYGALILVGCNSNNNNNNNK